MAALLPREQRQLLELWSSGTVSTRALAGLLGCTSGTLVRRIHAMHRRLTQPMAKHLAMAGGQLAPTHREIAVRVFVHGEPQRQVARELGMSIHEVRRIADEVRGWSAAKGSGRRPE